MCSSRNLFVVKKTAFLTLLVFTLASATGGPAFADAWSDYQALRTAQKTQNQQLLKDFRGGKITADELQDAWKDMRENASAAARRVADEWRGDKPETDTGGGQEPADTAAENPPEDASGEPDSAPDLTVHPEGGRLTGPGVRGGEDKHHFVPGHAPADDDDSLSGQSGLEPEDETVEYRHGTEDTHVRKLSGLKKFTNITIKRDILANDELWYFPSWEELQQTAIPEDQQDPVDLPSPNLTEHERSEKGRELEKEIKKNENELEQTKEAYEVQRQEIHEQRAGLLGGMSTFEAAFFIAQFYLLTGRWLEAHLIMIALIFLIRLLWLQAILFNNIMGFMLASGKFGFNPLGGAAGAMLGRDLLFGGDGQQIEQQDDWHSS